MDQVGTWHRGRPWSSPHCARWGHSSPTQKGDRAPSPIFGPSLLWPNGWMHQNATWYGGRLGTQPRPQKGPSPPNYRSLQADKLKISLSVRNNCIMITNGCVALVGKKDVTVLMCQYFATAEDAFACSLPLFKFGIYRVFHKRTISLHCYCSKLHVNFIC